MTLAPLTSLTVTLPPLCMLGTLLMLLVLTLLAPPVVLASGMRANGGASRMRPVLLGLLLRPAPGEGSGLGKYWNAAFSRSKVVWSRCMRTAHAIWHRLWMEATCPCASQMRRSSL